jgi:putative transposase
MEYSHRYHAYPTQELAAELEHHIDIHENVDADDIGSAYKHHYRLPGWKDEFPVFSEVNSKALQRTVTRFYQNLDGLSEQKQNGRKVGKLKWKSPRKFQSMTFSQSGFELKNTSGRHATRNP